MLNKEDTLALLDWYHARKRVLPWREEATPYHVYLSEIMLQQTRVEAVRSYYLRFLDKFPTLASLAEGKEDDVLRLWQGLGYYSRGRNLYKTATIVKEKYGGELPKKEKELLSLPGIGRYTAHAILALADSLPYVALDGNLVRIYSRNTASELWKNSPEMIKEGEAYFQKAVSYSPKEVTSALMDLGELVCLPNGKPDCLHCPLQKHCLAHQQGKEEDYPLQPIKKERRKEERYLFLLRYQNKVVMQKRPEKGLLASLYEFPNVLKGKETIEQILKEKGFQYTSYRSLFTYRHIFSHLEWNLEVIEVELKEENKNYLFVPYEELSNYSLPSAFRKAREVLP